MLSSRIDKCVKRVVISLKLVMNTLITVTNIGANYNKLANIE